jgi:hypothetical protein
VRDFSVGVKELRASSGGDGSFTVDSIVAKDVVEVNVSHEAYGNYTNERVAVGTSDLEVVLKGLAVLHGQVVAEAGDVVSSFSVQAQAAPGSTNGRKSLKAQSFNSSDGSFAYRGVPAGVYNLHVRSPQFATTTIENLQVGDGADVDLGTIVLRGGGTVYGTVVDAATQQAIAGARVRIMQGSSRFISRDATSSTGGRARRSSPIQTTDSAGKFSFSGLKGGNLTLRVTHPGYVSEELKSVNPDVAAQSQGLVVALETGGEIQGTVLGRDGKPRARMSVYLISDDSSKNQTARTDQNGNFRFSGVPSGVFTVKAHQFGVSGESRTEQGEAVVNMAAGATQEVQLSLE